jgi:serine/threonine-protein kinase RsbW
MRASTPQVADLTIRNDVSELASLRDRLERLGAELGVPDKPLMQLQVALDEIASNVIKYGWPEGGNHTLCVRITGQPGQIEVEVIDDGREFDPRLAPLPEPTAMGRRRPGGLGIHMVKQLVDRLDYERASGRNRTIIIKRYTRRRVSDRRACA